MLRVVDFHQSVSQDRQWYTLAETSRFLGINIIKAYFSLMLHVQMGSVQRLSFTKALGHPGQFILLYLAASPSGFQGRREQTGITMGLS